MSDVLKSIFKPDERAYFDDPYSVYRELRDKAPVHLDEASGFWLITRYADVDRATSDYEIFSSSSGNTVVDTPVRVGKTLGSMDPPRHDELRKVIQRTLVPARISALLPFIRAETRKRLDTARELGSFDFVRDFSRPVLFEAIGQLLGLDERAAAESSSLMTGLFRGNDGPMGAVLPHERFVQIAEFLRKQLVGREIAPGDDLFSVLREAQENGAPLSDEEIVANLSTVLLAGNASIGHFFPNIIHAMWRFPDERRKVLDDPGKIMAVIEETVRWDTSTQCFARQVLKDVDVAGTVIPANSRAVVFYASANRDERVIEDPDIFDIDRRRVRNFGFGMGPHHCAGAYVARAILKAIMEEALPVLGEYDLDIENSERIRHVMVRGFVSLPMKLRG